MNADPSGKNGTNAMSRSRQKSRRRAQVRLDARPQLPRRQRRQPGALLVATRAHLRDELEVRGIRVERLANELVDGVGAVVLGGVDVVDAELDRAAQDGAGGGGVARRPRHARARELHRAEADAPDGLVAEEGRRGHACQTRPAPSSAQEGRQLHPQPHSLSNRPPISRARSRPRDDT